MTKITAADLTTFRSIYAEVTGSEVELAEGVFALDDSEITATDETMADFERAQGKPFYRDTIDGIHVASWTGYKGRDVVVAQFDGKTLAAGPGIKR